ncbi:response regulator transcription factor [Candidatus Acetothermia bacterium]|nr:response regulator transcription factor [Candidatus Acetothermia bacterium]
MIRIAIADDHTMVREGLRNILAKQSDIQIVGEVTNGREAVELVRQQNPDVILLDISMPEKDGIEATKEIMTLDVITKVLILTLHSNETFALHMLRAGARGFICKSAKSEELVNAIRKVSGDRYYLPPALESVFAEKYLSPTAKKQPSELLSDREFQVMRLLALGFTNREIAQQLYISVKTVDNHRMRILEKLKLRNNSDITRFAIQHGFIEN